MSYYPGYGDPPQQGDCDPTDYPCNDEEKVLPAYILAGYYGIVIAVMLVVVLCVRAKAKKAGIPAPKLKKTFSMARRMSNSHEKGLEFYKVDAQTGSKFVPVSPKKLRAQSSGAVTPPASPSPSSDVVQAGAEAMPGFTPQDRKLVEVKYYIGILIYILIATVILAAIVPALRKSLGNTPGQNFDSHPMNKALDALAAPLYGAYCHLFVAPFIILLKLLGRLKPKNRDALRAALLAKKDPPNAAKFAIFTMKMTCCQKVFMALIGFANSIVMTIIKILAFVGLDLSFFYFPAPFMEFQRYKMLVSNIRIDGRRVFLDATWHDVYLWYSFDRALNFITLTMWDKFLGKKAFVKWLDSRMEWLDDPPEFVTSSKFVYFTAKPPFCKALWYNMCVRPCFPPCTHAYAELKLHELKLDAMRFGDKKLLFDPPIGTGEWMVTYLLKSLCGLCGCWKKFLDSRLKWAVEKGSNPTVAAINNPTGFMLANPLNANAGMALPAGAVVIQLPAGMQMVPMSPQAPQTQPLMQQAPPLVAVVQNPVMVTPAKAAAV